jgi:hypothetical protein
LNINCFTKTLVRISNSFREDNRNTNFRMALSIDKKFILETESELGLVFPDEFKQKMMLENGGEINIDDET